MTFADTVAERERMQWRLKMRTVVDALGIPWIADLSAMKYSSRIRCAVRLVSPIASSQRRQSFGERK
jgi:hypothetical protein